MALLIALLAALGGRFGVGLDRIAPAEAAQIAHDGAAASQGVRFGDRFELLGVRSEAAGSWLTVDLVWRSLRAQPLDQRIGVHLTDEAGNIRTQRDYSQSLGGRQIEEGAIWREELSVPRSALEGTRDLRLVVYDVRSVLRADRGPRDWDGARLILPLPAWR